MSDIIEISEINLDDSKSLRSSNFGGGLELLINDKIKDSGKLDIVKSKQEFLKPSVIKRKKRQDAIRKNSYNLDN